MISHLISKHGYATSISHAFIFMHAHLRGYQHVTIVEDDAIFITSVPDGVVDDAREALQSSNAWTFIRLGYRPFFLETQHKIEGRALGRSVFVSESVRLRKSRVEHVQND